MSDLQCPARVIVAAHDSDPGAVLAVASGERVVAVYAPPDANVSAGAGASVPQQVAAALGVPLLLDEALVASADPRVAVASLADEHRGEAIVVLGPAPSATRGTTSPSTVAPAASGVALLAIGGDGWVRLRAR